MSFLLEVCVDNMQSALNAAEGGADRVELCQALEVGGLTPSYGFMRKVKEVLDIPVFTMIRPRSGNFFYSEIEVKQMVEDIQVAQTLGINGFVFGVLREKVDPSKKEMEVNSDSCQDLLDECSNVPVTFHRAFDLIKNSSQAASKIIELGFQRILTSGQEPTAYAGQKSILKLIQMVGSKIIIMPGCGINPSNLPEIMHCTKAQEYHSSAQLQGIISPVENAVKGTTFHSITSIDVVRNLKDILNTYKA